MAEEPEVNATLTAVKLAMRISHTALDDDITAEIAACMKDLEIVGVDKDSVAESDPIILNAIKLWCKANMTDDVAKQSAYRQAYDALKATLIMSTGYGIENEEEA
jgi:hypothetical protein